MSSRKSTDNTSLTGVSFAAGSSSSAIVQKDINYSQFIDPNRLLSRSGGFNGNAVEVWADGAVYDTVAGRFLFPGTDFNPSDINRR